MADKFEAETRSRIMGSIRSRSRLAEVCKALWKRGLRFRTNVKDLMGKPDIAIKKYKLVVFIDSCFWHCCPVHGTMPKRNVDFWTVKLRRNRIRDQQVTQHYHDNGWRILRVWEHQIRNDMDGSVDAICDFILEAKKKPQDFNPVGVISLTCRILTDIGYSLYLMSPVYFTSQFSLTIMNSSRVSTVRKSSLPDNIKCM